MGSFPARSRYPRVLHRSSVGACGVGLRSGPAERMRGTNLEREAPSSLGLLTRRNQCLELVSVLALRRTYGRREVQVTVGGDCCCGQGFWSVAKLQRGCSLRSHLMPEPELPSKYTSRHDAPLFMWMPVVPKQACLGGFRDGGWW